MFGIIGLYPLINDNEPRWWSLAIAGALLGVALFIPKILRPLNVLWFKFGMFLARFINPLVMLVIYVISVVPIALILRLSGKDLLRLRFAKDEPTYWIERTPPGPDPESLEEIF